MKLMLNLLILIGFFNQQGAAQTAAQYQVLQTVVEQELKASGTPLFLGCLKARTVFEPEILQEESGLLLSDGILTDLKEAADLSKTERWDKKGLKTIQAGNMGLRKVCLSPRAIEHKYKSTGKRQNILTVSQPIFDRDGMYCVVQIVYQKFFKSAYGGSYLLKCTPSGWKIIAEFESWIS